MSRPLIVALSLSLSLCLAGCNRAPAPAAATAADPAATTADAAIPAATATPAPPTATSGLQIQGGQGMALPGDFPADIFLPTPHSIENVTQLGMMKSVVLGLDAPSATLMDDIAGQMTAQGWTAAASAQIGSGMRAFSKPGRSVIYSLSLMTGRAQLSVQQSQRPVP